MLPVVYENYNYLLSMNINAEIYKLTSIHIKDTYRITSIHIKEHIEWLPFT
jgi:L-ribulose-5-phosphate 3-epimerase UlaE